MLTTHHPMNNQMSPWGNIQNAADIAPGIVEVSTSSHGGIKVSNELWQKMPEYTRQTTYSKGGWFEEDCDVCLVVVCFPSLFEKYGNIEQAKQIIEGTYPSIAQRMKQDGIWENGL